MFPRNSLDLRFTISARALTPALASTCFSLCFLSAQTALNRFHASIARSVLEQSGYLPDSPADAALIQRVEDLLMKKGLARPPLPERDVDLRGE